MSAIRENEESALDSSCTAPKGSWDDDNSTIARQDRGKSAYLVLLGCAIQQIPIWGFQLAYGVVQQYEITHRSIDGDNKQIGIVGTTMTGVIYISMPFISALLTRYQSRLRLCSIVGAVIAASSLVLAGFSTEVWHLICTLGFLHAIGAALLYTSTMMILGTWFKERRGLAFAITLSAKSGIGSAGPLIFAQLLDRLALRYANLVWAGIILLLSLPLALLLRPRRSTKGHVINSTMPHRVPWSPLKCRTVWNFILATCVFSAGYGLPQTYLASYATEVLDMSTTLSSSMLTVLAAPSVPASITFGILGDGNFKLRGRRINAYTVTACAALGSAIPAFLLWGFSSNAATLVLFSIFYGFFAGGYSATWSGVMKEVANERRSGDESDTSLMFGLLNGGRGVGYVLGGLIGARLLDNEPVVPGNEPTYGYGSVYAAMILFTGTSAVLGGSGLLWKVLSP